MKILICLLIVSILFASCRTLKPITPDGNRVELNTKNINLLDGEYQITAVNDTSLDLVLDLLLYKRENGRSSNSMKKKIAIKIIDGEHMSLKYFSHVRLIKSRIYNGKIKDGYFDLGDSGGFKVLLGVLNGYVERNARIGMLKNGNLTIDISRRSVALLVIVPFLAADYHGNGLEVSRIK